MADKSIFSRLRRLFSSNVIVRRVGKGKGYVLDTDHLQSSGNKSSFSDRFTRLHGAKGYNSNYNQQYNYYSSKLELFSDYEAMDLDSIIASALDIYSDECTLKDEEGHLLRITSEDENIKKILHNLFYDVLNIEFNLWPWIRNMCKYGDFYLKLDIQENIGVVNVVPLSAYEVQREEGFNPDNPYEVRFLYEGPDGRLYLENYEVAHFRLLSDSNFLPYGRAMIEPARKVWKQLVLMEDAMLIHRIMRAPERRIFKIDIGNIAPAEVDGYMQQIMNKMKKTPYVDNKTGDYNLKFNLMNMLEDYYLPVRGGQSGTEIDTLNGMDFGGIDDIEYLRNRMMAALKVPKAFLGYDETTEGKATLAAEDVRFARTIERIQRIVISELTKIAVVHLFSQGYSDEDLVNFNLELTSPSIIYEQEKINLLSEKVSLVSSMQDLQMISDQWIYEHIFNMTEIEWSKEQLGVIEDLKQKFRKDQIESEGNDPAKTNESFGTPHDIASMHVDNKNEENEIPDGGWPGAGRPKEPTKYDSQDHVRGKDPLGKKDLAKTFDVDRTIKHNFKKGSPLAYEGINVKDLLKSMKSKFKSKKVIQESLTKNKTNNSDVGTILDESKLIDS
jgi:hypothetical protein